MNPIEINPQKSYKILGGDLLLLREFCNDLPGRFAIPIHAMIVAGAKNGAIEKDEANGDNPATV